MESSAQIKLFSNITNRKEVNPDSISKTNFSNINQLGKMEKTHSKMSSSELSKTTTTSLFSQEEIKFAQNSLFIFDSDNKIRIKVQTIVFNKYFTIIIDCLIMINSILLVFETFNKYYKLTLYFNYLFTILFTIEFILKVIAFGFILEPHTYLRDPWNFLDFFVVITSLIGLLPGFTYNINSLRVFRLIRTLKTIKMFPNIRRFFKVILNSLLDLSAVFFMLFFFCLVFSILGLSLWCDRFNYLCRMTNKPINGKLNVNPLFNNSLCGGKNKCNYHPELCLSSFEFHSKKHYFMSKAYYWDDEINNEYFNYGLSDFDNIFKSFFVVFLVITGEGWAKVMYLMIDGYNYITSIIYFLICVITNYFFMLKLTIAVLLYNFEKSRNVVVDLEQIIRESKPGKTKLFRISYQTKLFIEANIVKYKKKYPQIKIKKSQKSKIYKKTFLDVIKQIMSFQLFLYVPKSNDYHHNCFIGYICYFIYQQPFMQIFFFLSVIANSIILAFQSGNNNKNTDIFQSLNIIFITIFLIEYFLIILGYGLKHFCSKWFFLVDFGIIIVSTMELIIKSKQNKTMPSTLSIFRVLKIFRVIKLLQSWVQFHIIMESIKRTAYRMLDFFFLFIIILYMYTLLGYSLFHNSLKIGSSGEYSVKKKSAEFNFDDFLQSLLSTFLIIIGDHWEDIFYKCYRSSYNNKISVLLYFFTLVLFGQIALMNIFLSYLIDNFEMSCWELERNVYFRKVYLSLFFAPFRTYNSEKDEQKRNLTKENAENVFKEYLSLSKKLKLAKQGKLVLIGKSIINFITNKANLIEDYLVIHKNKKLKNIKEIKFQKIFQDIYDIGEIQSKKIENLDSYNFIIDYEQRYEDDKKIKRSKSYNIDNELFHRIIDEKIENAFIPNDGTIEPKRKKYNRHLKTGIFRNKIRFDEHNILNTEKLFHLILNDLAPQERKKKRKLNLENERRKTILDIYKKQSFHNFHSKMDILENPLQEKPKQEIVNLTFEIKPSLGIRIKTHMINSSLFIFHKDWKITKSIKKITYSNEFNNVIFILIMINIIVISLDNPWVREKSAEERTIKILKYFFNSVFILEALLKIISDGFIIKEKRDLTLNIKGSKVFEEILNEINDNKNKQNFEQISENDKIIAIQKVLNKLEKRKAYLLDPVNIVDFFCTIIGLIEMCSDTKNLGYLRALRAIRSIRPVRVLTKSSNLSLLLKCLLISIPALGNILFICLLYLFIFSIIGMNLYGNRKDGFCKGNINYNREECLNSKNDWVYNSENYSTFWYSLKNNFELMLGENWGEKMILAYKLSNNKITFLFYISSIIIGNLFILNLIASVLIQKFRFLKYKKAQYPDLTTSEVEWLKIQKIMMKYKPIQKKSINKKETKLWKKELRKFESSKLFKKTINTLIILSTIELMLKYNGMPSYYNTMLNVLNIFFTICFTIEIIIKIISNGSLYFKNKWNVFDFTITLLCDILAILNILGFSGIIDTHSLGTFPLILRLFRVLRVFRMISHFGILRNLFNTVLIMMPSIANVGLIIGIIIIIYGNIGMNIFGTVPYRESITRTNNFRNFLSSSLLLFRVISGEDWNDIMNEVAYHDCRNKTSDVYLNDYYCFHFNIQCYDNYKINYTNIDLIKTNKLNIDDYDNNEISYHFTCGNNLSYFYFITFVIITPVILLNLCIVMVVEGFSDSMHESESFLNEEYMNILIKLWMDYDPQGKLFILPQEFVLIFKQLPPPFGINYDRNIMSNPLKYEKFRHQYKIFSKFLKEEKNNNFINNINFNDVLFNKNFSNLPYGFQFKNFYVSKNKKFYTDDIEVLRILNKLDLVSYIGNSKIILKNSYTFSNHLIGDEKESKGVNTSDYHYIHYVDACLALSRFAVSITQHIDYDKLREQLVNSYAINKWSRYFNAPIVFNLFTSRGRLNEIENRISNQMSTNVLNRVNKIYKTKVNKNPKLLINKYNWKNQSNKKRRKEINEYNMNISNLPFITNIPMNEDNSRFNTEQTLITSTELSKMKTLKKNLKNSNSSLYISPRRKRTERKELNFMEKLKMHFKL